MSDGKPWRISKSTTPREKHRAVHDEFSIGQCGVCRGWIHWNPRLKADGEPVGWVHDPGTFWERS